MLGKLHLICMKTEGFMLKLDVILTTFHTSVQRRKITFDSYNYNLFRYIFSEVTLSRGHTGQIKRTVIMR